MKRVLIAVCLAVCFLAAGCGKKDTLSKEPTITLYITKTGEKKTMPLEEYLYGVVAGEMLPNWPKEAYAAQAIIARTFTMEFLERGGVKDKYGTDLSDDITETQAYNPDAISDVIKAAVDETKGLVAKHQETTSRDGFTRFPADRLPLLKWVWDIRTQSLLISRWWMIPELNTHHRTTATGPQAILTQSSLDF